MFDHAFTSYMTYAYPADELMPLSCKGRYRNSEASRGDIDDVLGNFSLTLIDSLDTLAVFGKFDLFETAVMNVIENTDFDRDLVVSVFELNIRVVGGLIGAHVSINYIKEKYENNHFKWYTDELLRKAKELAYRLLPAFDTKSGLPTPRINLKYGITNELKISEREKYTCTACAGTLILEFAALSRLTGDYVFESKARQILDYIWDKRNRASGLVGTILNVHTGDWINKEASIGAGIDSYYEYLFKAYVLLGDNELLHRFDHHYESIMKYMSNQNGLIMQTVHMHMPHKQARTHMDSLLAFWPGLQAFKGDIKEAIKMHEQLYKVVKKYKFLPEAFLSDGSVHWANHPLRPEFLESTYYLYRATNDPYYLDIGKEIIDYLETYSRVKCGYAAIANVRTAEHEDRSDSFFYAETFKYLYLLFEEPGLVKIDVDDFLFSTEAHLLPLDLINMNTNQSRTRVDRKKINGKKMTCTSVKSLFDTSLTISKFRESVSSQQQHTPSSCLHSVSVFDNVDISLTSNADGTLKLKAANFVSGDLQHLEILRMMGIKASTINDGRIQLTQNIHEAHSVKDAENGLKFMSEMLELSKLGNFFIKSSTNTEDFHPISIISYPQIMHFYAGPAQFGSDLNVHTNSIFGELVFSDPVDGCGQISNGNELYNRIAMIKRGTCTFTEKVRNAEKHGAIGVLIRDNIENTAFTDLSLFAMSGDGSNDISIPAAFMFSNEAQVLTAAFSRHKSNLIAYIGKYNVNSMEYAFEKYLQRKQRCKYLRNLYIVNRIRQCDKLDDKSYAILFKYMRELNNAVRQFDSIVSLFDKKTSRKQFKVDIKNLISHDFDGITMDTLLGMDSLNKLTKKLIDILDKTTNFSVLNISNKYSNMLTKYIELLLNEYRTQNMNVFSLSYEDIILLNELTNSVKTYL